MYELNFVLYCSAEDQALAEQWQQRLTQLGVATEMRIVEQINARFLRQHPDLALLVDAQGLWLAANGMKMQPAWHEELPRLKRSSIKNELIARACNMAKSERILDATAGLGHDGLLLAWLGANVTLIERHPILFALLESSLEQAQQHPILAETAQRIQLLHTDAEQYLSALVDRPTVNEQAFDVIYLDPMFPQRDASQKQEKKQAQVKKQMQLLHLLLPVDGIMDLGENLLHLAQQQTKRVVVKRPKHAVFLADLAPQHQWQGDACRFDAYFQ